MTHSILIPTCNRPQFLARLLQSINNQTRLPNEIVVIDQSDDESTKQLFEAWVGPAGVQKKYLHRKVKSLIMARNAGLDISGDFDLVAFLDDDLDLQPTFCEEIVKVFEKDVEGKYAGGMGTFSDAKIQKHWLQKIFFMPSSGSGKFLPSGAQTFPYGHEHFMEVEFIAGGITFWRKKIICAFKFDERLVAYGTGDDVDVSYRISRKYKNFFQPRAKCFHDTHSPGRDKNLIYRRNWIQNFYYLAQKNEVSKLAFAWCVLGHFLRDALFLDVSRLRGDLQGSLNVLRGRLDSVAGYDEFVKNQQRGLTDS